MAVVTFNGTPSDYVNEALRKIVNDLTGYIHDAGGTPGTEYMKLVYPSSIDTSAGSLDFEEANDITIILEANTNLDPFANPTPPSNSATSSAYDPWRICFQTYAYKRWPYKDASGTNLKEDDTTTRSMAIYVGSPTTLWSDGTDVKIAWKQQLGDNLLPTWADGKPYDATYLESSTADLIEPLGLVGKTWTHNFDPITAADVKWKTPPTYLPTGWVSSVVGNFVQGDGPDVDDPGQLFVNRHDNSVDTTLFGVGASTKNSDPIIYKTVVSDHGLFISTWGQNPEEYGTGFSWMLVQRGVNKDTGIVRGLPVPQTGSVGNRPLFCVFGVGDAYGKFVVREHDLDIPSEKKNAARNTEDSAAVLNPYQQQSLTENGEYVVTFINNLNSSRFKYADELDMLGTVSADVIGGGTTIEVNVYGETDNRTYEAMWPGGVAPELYRVKHVATDGQTSFAMTFAGVYKDGTDLEVYKDGILLNPLKYKVTYGASGTVVLTTGVSVGTTIEIVGTGKKVGAFGTGMRIVVVQDIPTPNTP